MSVIWFIGTIFYNWAARGARTGYEGSAYKKRISLPGGGRQVEAQSASTQATELPQSAAAQSLADQPTAAQLAVPAISGQVLAPTPSCRSATDMPTVDVVMSCYNEELVLRSAVDSLERSVYPNYRIVLIDDKSTDDTLSVMRELEATYPNITAIASPKNLGKAKELNTAVEESRAKYVLCVDADGDFHPQAIGYLVDFMERHPESGAVTGRPSVLNTQKIIAKLQWLEYAMSIDFIKRAQYFFFDHVLTVSGVLTMFRRSALRKVGGWDPSALTEDIDITWRLYREGYTCGYEPRALCNIYVPETVSGFVKQRVRWSRGGVEVSRKRFGYFNRLTLGAHMVALDAMLSYVWIVLMAYSLLRMVADLFFSHNLELRMSVLMLYFISTVVCYLMARIVNIKTKEIVFPRGSILLLPIYFYLYWLYTIVVTMVAMYHMFDYVKFAAWGDSDRGAIE